MTSMLRLGGKDRSGFLLFKQKGSNSYSENTADVLAYRLPDISHVDTRSLSDLFNQFSKSDHLDALPGVGSQHRPSKLSNVVESVPANFSASSADPVKPLGDQAERRDVNLLRNDSTASSSYSQPSRLGSDPSPAVTRHSSSSSYTPEPFSAMSTTISQKPSPLSIVTHKRTTSSSTSTTVSRLQSYKNKPQTSSYTMLVSTPTSTPNLDKPLPPGPSSSEPDLSIQQRPAELPSHDSAPGALELQRASARSEASVVVRPASAGQASAGQSAPKHPSWSSRSVREARLRKAVDRGQELDRSLSQPTFQPYDPSDFEKFRRHTADILTPEPKVAPIAKTARARRTKMFKPITAATAEQVIYRIMCNLHSLQDLQSTAMVSKGFYRTFRRNESKLVSDLILRASNSAWEYRRSVLALKESDDFVLREFRRDCNTLTAVKAFIHPDQTIRVDNALWRIWTFCVLFGAASGQIDPPRTQMDWLNGSKGVSSMQWSEGFAIGNGKGLSTTELEDMDELWQYLQMLITGFTGREQEARKAGVFDNFQPGAGITETEHLAEWIAYLLTLGPQTVLALSSCSFDQAKMIGLTKWPAPEPGRSRSSFLTASITQVYQERLLEEASLRAAQFRIPPPRANHRPTRSFDRPQLATTPMIRATVGPSRGLRIDTSTMRRPISVNALADARFEGRPDCDPASNVFSPRSEMFPASATADPNMFYALGMTSKASTKLGATLFPIDYANPGPRVPFPAAEASAAPKSEVVDPVDKAMAYLVHEMGFAEVRARKALAMCDTGAGINLEKAIELLAVDSKDSKNFSTPVELPTPSIQFPAPSVPPSPAKLRKQPKDFCDGHCPRTSTSMHSRKRSTGTTGTSTDVEISPVSATDEAEWQDTISPLVTPKPLASRSGTKLSRGSSKGAKAWKVLGIDNTPKRKNSVLRIDEYQAKVERRKTLRAADEPQTPRVKDGLGKNLLGLGLGIASGAGAKSAEEQLERAREEERRKKEKQGGSMLRYA
ncbi:hypothetical protein LTR10_022990 [Elasticomyces elasticus]|uniref:UBA domain-containing protein n=1 Tax=Exophiala sideris TaxID=1016849 RepID=A0ABR0JN15_9EURO|nr:hypothetical protein LTR10_022990 [Elasticomyces elasticus]KAK5036456.1 hypothetical protein LTS07_002183 [Exophiala sideris]KAK5041715.1 hypothetical protein LTR13_002382 [Exophiala sideris]KAK5066839.1 hypothetical protein LTR69_002187 [Exophiala sideris]KAK5184898.1 hypothetical protein LTR44_002744 [Eurotiomycetes sp. CCFEE 6388]